MGPPIPLPVPSVPPLFLPGQRWCLSPCHQPLRHPHLKGGREGHLHPLHLAIVSSLGWELVNSALIVEDISSGLIHKSNEMSGSTGSSRPATTRVSSGTLSARMSISSRITPMPSMHSHQAERTWIKDLVYRKEVESAAEQVRSTIVQNTQIAREKDILSRDLEAVKNSRKSSQLGILTDIKK